MSKSSPFPSHQRHEQSRLQQLIWRLIGRQADRPFTDHPACRAASLPVLQPNPQEMEQLSRQLRALPRRSQQVFLLSRLDGLSYANLAERLGVSLSTVEKDMLRVLQHCQRLES